MWRVFPGCNTYTNTIIQRNTLGVCHHTCVDSARELLALAQKLIGAGVSSGMSASSRLLIRGFLVGSWLVSGVTLFLLIRVPWLLFNSWGGGWSGLRSNWVFACVHFCVCISCVLPPVCPGEYLLLQYWMRWTPLYILERLAKQYQLA